MIPNLAYCGLVCEGCPIYWATHEEDPERKERIIEESVRILKEQFGVTKLTKEMTDCDGCSAGGRLFSGCADCTIRTCAVEKGLKTCAGCDDYPCSRLKTMFKDNPSQKARLDILRAIR